MARSPINKYPKPITFRVSNCNYEKIKELKGEKTIGEYVRQIVEKYVKCQSKK